MQNGGLFLGRLCLSCKFKEETGESLTDVILKEKNGEGQRLLRYSDKPLTAIGSYPWLFLSVSMETLFKSESTYAGLYTHPTPKS